MFNEENFEKKMSLRFIQTMNRHLPAKRKNLKELLDEEKPGIKCRDGSTHHFDKEELGKLATMIPNEEHERLRLPIYLEMSSSLERGTIKISGRLECSVIRRILGSKKPGEDSMTVYYPHLLKIRAELSTTTQYMFTT